MNVIKMAVDHLSNDKTVAGASVDDSKIRARSIP